MKKIFAVVNGYDWGPAVDKLIIEQDSSTALPNISPEHFKVDAITPYDKGTRTVIEAYPSDASGTYDPYGAYITLVLDVHPALSICSPFYYDRASGRNIRVDMQFSISYRDEVLDALQFKLISPDSDKFDHDQMFTLDDTTLTFAHYTPHKMTQSKTPLIIWLHGAGEGGTDTTIPVLGNYVTGLIKPEIQSFFGENGAYVLVPQTTTMWMDYNGQSLYNKDVAHSDGFSYYEEILMTLIQDFVNDHADIDTDRIYLGGCSNGGYMTVKFIIDYPGYFAAAFPAAEAYEAKWLNDERILAMKNTPLWLTHAQNDPVICISENYAKSSGPFIPYDNYSNALYDRLVATGHKNIHYSRFDSVVDTSGIYFDSNGKPYAYHGHWSWIYALNNTCKEMIDGEALTLFQWLAMQSLSRSL